MKYIKLGELCDLQNGFAFKSSDYVKISNTLNCRMSNIRPGAIFDLFYNPKYLPDNFSEKYSEFLLSDGDIVIAMTDLAGDPKILGVPAQVKTEGKNVLLNQRVGKLIIKDPNLDFRYLKYVLSNPRNKDYYKKFSGGGLQINISKKDILNLVIPLHNSNEQAMIADKLDIIQTLIDNKNKQINMLNELIKSHFIEMFENKNYPKMKGKELFSFSSGKFLEESKRKEFGIPVYGGNGIVWYTDYPLIDFETIVFGRVGAYCGNVKIIEEPAWITDNAIYIKEFKKDVYHLKFLYNMLEFIDFSRFAQHSGQPKITQKPLDEYDYVIPPINEQLKFAQIVEQIDKQKLELGKSLKKLEEMQSALMQEYFG